MLQRLDGDNWRTVASTGRTSPTYSLTYKAPLVAGVVHLRVFRGPFLTKVSAAHSAPITLRVVSKHFVVTAAADHNHVSEGGKVVITGRVTPTLPGHLVLQRKVAGNWAPIVSGLVAAGGRYSLTTTLTHGPYTFRVVRAPTSTVAPGYSKPFTVTAQDIVLGTAALPKAYNGVAYHISLTATGGNAPYHFLGYGVPAGLTLADDGTLSGKPVHQGTTTIAVQVTDSAGVEGFGTTPLLVGGIQVAGWGALETGAPGSSTVPTATLLPSDVAAIVSSNDFTLALTTAGTVWGMGFNGNGELGLGVGVDRQVLPTQIGALHDVVAIAAGTFTGYALEADGSVWAWGSLQIGTSTGDPYFYSPVKLPDIGGVVAISASQGSLVALQANGEVQVREEHDGYPNELGRSASFGIVLGLGSPTNRVTAVAAGAKDGYALLADGTVKAWGSPEDGALGIGATNPAGPVSSAVTVTGLTGVTQLVCGSDQSCFALHGDGTVSSWGQGSLGDLGTGSTADAPTPVLITGLSHVVQIAHNFADTWAVTDTGALYGWGSNSEYQLGIGTKSDTPVLAPTLGPVSSHVVGVASGWTGTFVLEQG